MAQVLGKDAPLEESIERMSAGLKALGFEIEETRWVNPVPHAWSVHVRDRRCPMLCTNGKGATREAALASALGEFFERLSCNYFFADYYWGAEMAHGEFVHFPQERWFPVENGTWPEGLLDDETRGHYDPENELLPEALIDLSSGNTSRGICALPFVKQRTGTTLWFPVNIIGNLYVSNGMAAGNTVWEARVQALSEIIERYVKNTIIGSGIALPPIPESKIAKHPKVSAAVEALRSEGFVIEVRDASLGGRFPVVNVTLIHPDDGGAFASFGAHPKFEVALDRTVTELLQGRELDQLNSFPEPTLDLEEAADPQNLEAHFINSSGVVAWDMLAAKSDYPFVSWNIAGDTKAEFEQLCDCIHLDGREIFIADYDHLGVYCCRIVVPGMSEIYPVDDLLWSNNNSAAHLRAAILALPDLTEEACRELLECLDDGGFDNQQSVAELIGLVPDEDTIWSWLRVGELKLRLALAVQDHPLAHELSQWVLGFANLPAVAMKLNRSIGQFLGLLLDPVRHLDDFLPILERMYGKDLFAQVRSMVQHGEGVFSEFGSHDQTLATFGQHQQMLRVLRLLPPRPRL